MERIFLYSEIFVGIKEGHDLGELEALLSFAGVQVLSYWDNLRTAHLEIDTAHYPEVIAALEAWEGTAHWDLNELCHRTASSLGTPTDQLYQLNRALWGTMKIEYAWNLTKGNPSVKIGIADSGYQADHPDLVGLNVVSTRQIAPLSVLTSDQWEGVQSVTHPVMFHGTAIANIMGAQHGTNGGKGLAGVAPDCSYVIYKIDNPGTEDDVEWYDFTSLAYIQSAMDSAITDGLKALNISWTMPFNNTSLASSVTTAWNAGVVLVIAAGNSGTDLAVTHPGWLTAFRDNAIIVGATGADRRRALYRNSDGSYVGSCYGGPLALAAPSGARQGTGPEGDDVLQCGYITYKSLWQDETNVGFRCNTVAGSATVTNMICIYTGYPDLSVFVGGGVGSDYLFPAGGTTKLLSYDSVTKVGVMSNVASATYTNASISIGGPFVPCKGTSSVGSAILTDFTKLSPAYVDAELLERHITGPGLQDDTVIVLYDSTTNTAVLSKTATSNNTQVNFKITGRRYERGVGTSYAAPMVAAIIGLMYSVNPDLTPTIVKNALQSTAQALPLWTPASTYGSGLVDAYAAVSFVSLYAVADPMEMPIEVETGPVISPVVADTLMVSPAVGDAPLVGKIAVAGVTVPVTAGAATAVGRAGTNAVTVPVVMGTAAVQQTVDADAVIVPPTIGAASLIGRVVAASVTVSVTAGVASAAAATGAGANSVTVALTVGAAPLVGAAPVSDTAMAVLNGLADLTGVAAADAVTESIAAASAELAGEALSDDVLVPFDFSPSTVRGELIAEAVSVTPDVSSADTLACLDAEACLVAVAEDEATLTGQLLADSVTADCAAADADAFGLLFASDMEFILSVGFAGLGEKVLTGGGSIRSPSGAVRDLRDIHGNRLNIRL